MQRWTRHMFILIGTMSLLCLSYSLVFAVAQNVRAGGMVVDDLGSVPNLTVRVTQFAQDGTVVKSEETKTDKNGVFAYVINEDSYRTRVEYVIDGIPYVFNGPFTYLDLTSRKVDGKDVPEGLLVFDTLDAMVPIWSFGPPSLSRRASAYLGERLPDTTWGGPNRYPYESQNPRGPFGGIGLGTAFRTINMDMDVTMEDVKEVDTLMSGGSTSTFVNRSRSANRARLTNGLNPNIRTYEALGEVFGPLPHVYTRGVDVFSALFIFFGAGNTDLEQNTTLGSSDQASSSGTTSFVTVGTTHVIHSRGVPWYFGGRWNYTTIPSTSLGQSVSGGQPSDITPGFTQTGRTSELSYHSTSLDGRVGWILCACLDLYVGVGGTWSSAELTSEVTEFFDGGPSFSINRKTTRTYDYDGGGPFGLAGFNFVAFPNVLGRFESQFYGDGYGLLFKIVMPNAFDLLDINGGRGDDEGPDGSFRFFGQDVQFAF